MLVAVPDEADDVNAGEAEADTGDVPAPVVPVELNCDVGSCVLMVEAGFPDEDEDNGLVSEADAVAVALLLELVNESVVLDTLLAAMILADITWIVLDDVDGVEGSADTLLVANDV